MFSIDKAAEARYIYVANSVLRKYRINFYYSLRKDVIFLFAGRSVKEVLYAAYFLAAIGSVTFLLAYLNHDQIRDHSFLVYLIYGSGMLFLLAGLYILLDFYRKLKFGRSKTMITRKGISFRNGDQSEFWPYEKIKNISVVFTLSKKNAGKPSKIRPVTGTKGKIVVFSNLGQKKDLVCINNSNKNDLKGDLEMILDTINRFIKSEANQEKTDFVLQDEKAVYQSAASNPR